MPTRSTSYAAKIFERRGSAGVTYDLSTRDRTTITVPPGSTWTSELHWHETHTEFLEILQGRAFVRLGGRAGVFGPDDGVIEVPRYTVHEWCRSKQDDMGENLVVREWTAPADGQKEVFFRMLNSFLMEHHPESMYDAPFVSPAWLNRQLSPWIVPLQLFMVFRCCDNWPVLWGDDSGWFSWLVTHAELTLCSGIGHLLGLRGAYPEYIDEELTARTTIGRNAKKAQ